MIILSILRSRRALSGLGVFGFSLGEPYVATVATANAIAGGE